MRPLADIRRDNLAVLVGAEPSQAAFARKIGKDKNQVNQWLGRAGSRNISSETAREIERVLSLTPGWMDHDRSSRIGEQSPPHYASQPAGLDAGKLALVLGVVEGAIADSRKRVPTEFKARMIKRVYESQPTLSADSASAVQAALAGLLETVGNE